MIEFRNIQVSDGGEWTCEARNSAVDDKEKTIVKTLTKFINIECKGILYLLFYFYFSSYCVVPRIIHTSATAFGRDFS